MKNTKNAQSVGEVKLYLCLDLLGFMGLEIIL